MTQPADTTSTTAPTSPSAGSSITTIDPTTGSALEPYRAMTDDDVDAVLGAAAQAARRWGRQTVEARLAVVAMIADVLEQRGNSIAQLITAEMGKPLTEAQGEVDKSVATARWYAAHAGASLSARPVEVGPTATAWVTHEPLGLVLAVMPWNFPLWQVMRFVLPALAAGDGIILKHSPNVTGCALFIERLLITAGLPVDTFRALVVDEPRVGPVIERIIADDRVAAVTLTGSNRAGAAVGAAAGRAMKPSVLELGGSDPFIVLEDADLERAVPAAVRARFHNAGQSCVCAKRFVVSAAVADAFIPAFVEAVRALRIGDPRDPATDIGPLARADLRDAIDDQVRRSIEAGAHLLTGGDRIGGPGFFYAPTVLRVDGPGIAAFDEETFGPVAVVVVARDDAHAAELANATDFGLGMSIWSADAERALAVAAAVTTGAVFVNAVVASDPRLPFGGTKRSGHGRELAESGLHAFTNERTFWAAN